MIDDLFDWGDEKNNDYDTFSIYRKEFKLYLDNNEVKYPLTYLTIEKNKATLPFELALVFMEAECYRISVKFSIYLYDNKFDEQIDRFGVLDIDRKYKFKYYGYKMDQEINAASTEFITNDYSLYTYIPLSKFKSIEAVVDYNNPWDLVAECKRNITIDQ